MIDRRRLLTLLTLAPLGVLTMSPALSGCASPAAADDLARSDLAREAADPASAALAHAAVTDLTADLHRTLAATVRGNLVSSPFSVAMALGMTVQGARGATASELLATLHAPSAADLASGLNALDAALATRAGTVRLFDGSEGEVALSSANSLWGQRDTVWDKGFLDTLARHFGSGMHQVDYRTAPDQARREVNAWVGEQTRERIPELIADGVFTVDTRLTLVNAVYLKAPWQLPFDTDATRPAPFTRLDGSTVQADLMHAPVTGRFGRGEGWVAATVPYADGRLAMTVVLPDVGRFAELEQNLDGAWLRAVQSSLRDSQVQVSLPRWTTRSQLPLRPVLEQLGTRLAFTDDADFSGITSQEPLLISAVIHEAFIAVDEAGTEAAAATAVVMMATGAPADPVTLIADRPFLYVIHDNAQGALPTPLFIGRVLDPTGR
ncbi:MAG: serpin family protein [Kineosporiaceae bacterium]|nr:serpin family protein [Kineosporiaceae bacterium]